jgi:hypothetical protein
MNPPFTRSVGGNLLFGNAPVRQRRRMQRELQQLVQRLHVHTNITAGLGSVFSALGHQLVKPGGHLSLVLPRALLSGVSWEPTRLLIGANYHVRYIIVSHEPHGWNFSENTELSECMIVAKRLRENESAGPTKVINLWSKPTSSVEALTFARSIEHTPGVALDSVAGVDDLFIGERKVGEVRICPQERIAAGSWQFEAAFAQTDLCRVAYHASSGRVYILGRGMLGEFAITQLGRLGELGPDRRDIHDGFRLAQGETQYPALWGHNTETVQTLQATPNRYLSALARALAGRNLRDPHLLWSRAGRVLIAERLRLGTTRVVGVWLSEPVLSNTWWPMAFTENPILDSQSAETILIMWLNSTLGILSLVAARVETQGPWIEMKKPILERLDVLDPYALNNTQVAQLLQTYDELANEVLQSLPNMDSDEVRARLDQAVMQALNIDDDLNVLRRMVSSEPLFTGVAP